MRMTINKKKFPNGLIFASDSMSNIETLSIIVMVKAGSKNETAVNNGIAHFLEHMAFKGTKSRSALDIAKQFDDIGGNLNAYTSREKTAYYAKILKGDVEVALDILADITQNSIFALEEIEKEREVILQEIAQTVDTPDDILFERFQEIAFPNQAFGRSILGTIDNVKNFTRNQLISYVNDNYFAPNIIVSVAGNLHHKSVADIVEKKFAGFNLQGNQYEEEITYKGGEISIPRSLEQIQIVLAFKGVSLRDPDYFTQQVLAVILGGSSSSRLFQEIREKRGLAYFISAYSNSYLDDGIFGIYGGVSVDNANEYLDVVIEETLKLTIDLTEEEIQRAKVQLQAGILMSYESSTSRAEKLANNLADFGKYITIEQVIQDIKKVDKTALIRFAKKLFSQKSLPTLASIGKIDKLYKYEQVIQKLKL